MSSSIKTFSFAAITCLICSLLLTATATGLKERQDFNREINVKKNILKVMNLIAKDSKFSPKEVESIYNQNIKDLFLTENGDITDQKTDLPIHIIYKGNDIESYALPVAGYGLWSTLYGYMAIEGDGNTVRGITIYDHKETPGLGGECDKPWFTNQFIGKKITDKNGKFVSVGIVKGKAKDTVSSDELVNYVDGMSGATITTKGMDEFLREDLSKYEKFSKKLRS